MEPTTYQLSSHHQYLPSGNYASIGDEDDDNVYEYRPEDDFVIQEEIVTTSVAPTFQKTQYKILSPNSTTPMERFMKKIPKRQKLSSVVPQFEEEDDEDDDDEEATTTETKLKSPISKLASPAFSKSPVNQKSDLEAASKPRQNRKQQMPSQKSNFDEKLSLKSKSISVERLTAVKHSTVKSEKPNIILQQQ